jgi:glycosyltransferase involved in cell wall biosynthesis
MEKIISIIVPTYNMEKYLKRCLDSVLDHKWDNDVEVIVINDGSTDLSLQIALEYKEKFPRIVVIINKKNGHYGSTINAALPMAKGKYIKILDADDWFNTEEFSYFINKLKEIESDLIISNYTRKYASGKERKYIFSLGEHNIYHDFSVMLSSKRLCDIEMHAISYRTELIRHIGYKQTEGLPYTDSEWAFYPLFFVNTIAFIDANIYQYFIGREDQTVNMSVRLMNLITFSVVVNNMFSYYLNFSEKILDDYKKECLWNKILARYRYLYTCYLIFQPHKDFDATKMKEFDKSVKEKSERLYSETTNITIHKFIPLQYVRYWRCCSKRFPQWIISILVFARKCYDC